MYLNVIISLFFVSQSKIMMTQGYGKIINTAALASVLVPHPLKQAAYTTLKAGVVQLSGSLAAGNL